MPGGSDLPGNLDPDQQYDQADESLRRVGKSKERRRQSQQCKQSDGSGGTHPRRSRAGVESSQAPPRGYYNRCDWEFEYLEEDHDDGGDDENGEEFEPMDAGAEAQEALASASTAEEPSAFAPEKTEELRRDGSASEPSSSPDSDDDLQ